MTAADATTAATAGAGGEWPHTRRLLPWAVVAFAVMLWLVPFDAMVLPVPLPVDSKPDRFLLPAIVVLWILAISGRDRGLRPSRRANGAEIWTLVLVLVAVASLALNAVTLTRTGDMAGGLRSLSLLLSYAALFFVVATSLRPPEVRPLLDLFLGLAVITAVGTLIEYRTGFNVFYRGAGLIPGVTLSLPPEAPADARTAVFGPTGHPLAICTVLAMMVPYALLRLVDATRTRPRLVYGMALFLLAAGAVSTQRKSAVVVPVAAIVVVLLYRRARLIRLAPLLIVAVIGLQIIAPAALSGIRYQFSTSSSTSGSTGGRVDDYAAIAPDIARHPALGRGYGTYEARKYRYLDNQYLGLAITVGGLGLIAFVGFIASGAVIAHRASRAGGVGSADGVAIVAALVTFLVSSALFDSLAFRQMAYIAFVFVALACVLGRGAPAQAGPGRASGART